MILKLLLLGFVCGAEPSAPVLQTVNDNWGGKEVMNGYRLKDFGNFDEIWKMVTVRYRHDTKEQRFTYANPKAYKALISGNKDYPDGAIFAKIGYITEPDPLFTSSAVPSGAKRYQFMVRDKKKYKDTDGWGYVLFQGDGKTFPEDPQQKIMACAACHRVVAERGYVFSVPIFTSPKNPKSQMDIKASADPLKNKIRFEDAQFQVLPAALQKIVPAAKTIRKITGELESASFQGTLNEIRPTLIEEAKRSGRLAVLLTKDAHRFSAVVPAAKKECGAGTQNLRFIYSQAVPVDGGKLEYRMMQEEGCY